MPADFPRASPPHALLVAGDLRSRSSSRSNPAEPPSRVARGRIHGTITFVQERRFQLVDDCGVAHLFVLGASARVDPRALGDIAGTGVCVSVSYRDSQSDLFARVATDLTRLED